MTLLLIGMVTTMLLELVLYSVPFFWHHQKTRQIYGACITVSLGLLAGALVTYLPHITTVVLAIISAYRVLNVLRVIDGRSTMERLQRVSARTGTVLAGLQIVVLLLWGLAEICHVSWRTALFGALLVALGVSIVVLASTIRRLRHTKFREHMMLAKTTELPSVTVAIPARNETTTLEECLQSVIASDYPKLEILVLDDCSQNRRTPEIIRSFAHAGVRFIKGEQPRDGWLAKNQAYDQLVSQANGEIMLFCGVDVRFGPDTIRALVSTLVYKEKRMMSFLPLRHRGPKRFELSLLQAARYFWELAPPRKLFRRPAVLSSAWLMYRKDIQKAGGFKAVSNSVAPEAHFAKMTAKNDTYSFMRAHEALALFSVKDYQAQQSTAIRTRYPQLRRRPETVLLVSAAGVVCFLLPFVTLVLGLCGLLPWLFILLATAASVCFIIACMLITMATRTASSYLAVFAFVPMILADIVMMHVSMWRYEFSEVIWKGRNICVPIMHVEPHLPRPAEHRTF